MPKQSSNAPREVVAGGRKKGFIILKHLLAMNAHIVYCFILPEDVHEIEIASPDIINLCREKNIPYTVCASLKKHDKLMEELHPDILIVAGWRTIISPTILMMPTYRCVALHESLLPKYRGFAPVNWAIINGETKTGVTLFYLDNGVDSGNIIGQETIRIGPDHTAGDIYQKTIGASLKLLDRFHKRLINGTAPRHAQTESEATYTCARCPEDGHIDWGKSTTSVHNLIRGLSFPFPGAFSFVGSKKIIIQKAYIPSPRKFAGRIPGRVVAFRDTGVEVLTGDGSIMVERVQQDGGEIMSARTVLKSIRSTLT